MESLGSWILNFNRIAMDYLKKDNHKQAQIYLKKADRLLNRVMSSLSQDSDLYWLVAVTLNNFGCYYKKLGKNYIALDYLKKALEVEEMERMEEVSIAATKLNICAIYAKLEDHYKAYKQALGAVRLLESLNASNERKRKINTTLIIAYYNLGLEWLALDYTQQALNAYRSGYHIALLTLGKRHSLTVQLQRAYSDIRAAPLISTDSEQRQVHASVTTHNGKNTPKIITQVKHSPIIEKEYPHVRIKRSGRSRNQKRTKSREPSKCEFTPGRLRPQDLVDYSTPTKQTEPSQLNFREFANKTVIETSPSLNLDPIAPMTPQISTEKINRKVSRIESKLQKLQKYVLEKSRDPSPPQRPSTGIRIRRHCANIQGELKNLNNTVAEFATITQDSDRKTVSLRRSQSTNTDPAYDRLVQPCKMLLSALNRVFTARALKLILLQTKFLRKSIRMNSIPSIYSDMNKFVLLLAKITKRIAFTSIFKIKTRTIGMQHSPEMIEKNVSFGKQKQAFSKLK